MPEAYLSIDDSPSPRTDDLIDYLEAKEIRALLFCRGDFMEDDPDPVIRAIEKGFVVGNHTYAHPRASMVDLGVMQADVLKTEKLIESAYTKAGVQRPGKYFRFSYMDRGMGAWVVDFNRLHTDYHAPLKELFWEGLNFCSQAPPMEEQKAKFTALQEFLRVEGFTSPFEQIKFGWWRDTEIAVAADCFFTFSTADWMLTKRHMEKNWPYKTLEDLRAKIDEDRWLQDKNSRHVILAHDQGEIHDVTVALTDHLLVRGFEFLDFSVDKG